jgi:hypothetical protein
MENYLDQTKSKKEDPSIRLNYSKTKGKRQNIKPRPVKKQAHQDGRIRGMTHHRLWTTRLDLSLYPYFSPPQDGFGISSINVPRLPGQPGHPKGHIDLGRPIPSAQ